LTLRTFFVDHSVSVPPHAQLKEQVKVAYAFGRLRPGDVLPSIRSLARQLGVGEATVRRAYDELRRLGILTAERRKHVTISNHLARSRNVEKLASECAGECDRFLAWAKEKGLNPISVARFLHQRALAREARSPSCVYVDASTASAVEFAEMISQAWEIKVGGISLEELGRLSRREVDHFTTVLVNYFRYERVLELISNGRKGIFPLKIKPKEQILRRVYRLPPGSSILQVFPDEDFKRLGKSVLDYFQDLIGKKWRAEGMPLGKIHEWGDLVANGKHGLIIISPHLWHEIPDKLKKLPVMIRSQNEPDPQSLEEIRIQAGVLT